MRGSKRRKGPDAWQLRVYLGTDETGKKRYLHETFYGKARDADGRLNQLVASVDSGASRKRANSFAEVAEVWLGLLEERIEDATYTGYRIHLDRWVLPRWGKVQVAAIRAGDLDRWYLTLQQAGAGPATIAKVHAVMRGVLGRAVTDGLASVNAAKDATLPRNRRKRKIEAPTVSQVRELLSSVEDDPVVYTFLYLAATTGARRGELAALQWGDLDGERLLLRRAIAKDRKLGTLITKDIKTHNQRWLTIPPGTAGALAAYRAWLVERGARIGVPYEGPFLFSSDLEGRVPTHPDTWTHKFKACAASVSKMEGFSLHDLRHFAASELVAAGTDLSTIRDRLGWTSNAMLDTYAHRLPERDREASEHIDKLLGGG